MMSLTFGLFTKVSGSGPLGPLVYKTIAPTVPKFYMEHDLPPGSQNYKIGSG